LEKELERQKRTGDPVGVIMADADHFKKINDNLGHSVGDQVLREVAQRMKDALRSYDWVGRYGGEEFLIVVHNCDGNSTFASAERLRKSVTERPVISNAGPVPITLSMGVIAATGCTQGLDSSTLLRLADEALYTAKRPKDVTASKEHTSGERSPNRFRTMAIPHYTGNSKHSDAEVRVTPLQHLSTAR
jgi:two-component system cell cycle response regulator